MPARLSLYLHPPRNISTGWVSQCWFRKLSCPGIRKREWPVCCSGQIPGGYEIPCQFTLLTPLSFCSPLAFSLGPLDKAGALQHLKALLPFELQVLTAHVFHWVWKSWVAPMVFLFLWIYSVHMLPSQVGIHHLSSDSGCQQWVIFISWEVEEALCSGQAFIPTGEGHLQSASKVRYFATSLIFINLGF